MKAKDLIIPFKWEDRKPVILDKLLYIPNHYDKHDLWEFPLLSSEKIFGNDNKVNVEFCSGNGQWIVEKSKQYPDINWLAVEMRFDRARKIWVKAHNEHLKNLFVVLGDGRTFADYYLMDDSIDDVFVNFPDPWPKRKHQKHLLLTDDFIKKMSEKVKLNGNLTIATDDDFSVERILSILLDSKSWLPLHENPFYITSWDDYGDSYFCSLWKNKQRSIKYLQFSNNKY